MIGPGEVWTLADEDDPDPWVYLTLASALGGRVLVVLLARDADGGIPGAPRELDAEAMERTAAAPSRLASWRRTA